jgi:hypothetical protein
MAFFQKRLHDFQKRLHVSHKTSSGVINTTSSLQKSGFMDVKTSYFAKKNEFANLTTLQFDKIGRNRS